MAKESLRDRIKAVAAVSAPSLNPAGVDEPPPPPPEKVEIPQLSDLIEDRKKRLEVARMVAKCGELSLIKSKAEKESKPIKAMLKAFFGKIGEPKTICGDWKTSYYAAPRKSIKEDLLTQALLKRGIQPVVIGHIIKESSVGSDGYTLRITPIGAKDEEGED